MAKKNEAELKKEQEANEARNAETLARMAGVGEADAQELAASNEVDPFESIPHVTPGKPGFDRIGQTLAGYFIRTKRVVNENSKAAKLDPKTGEKVRFLHILEDKRGTQFGIWGVGSLDAVMRNMRSRDFIAVTYDGVAEEALKPGQNPPHKFIYKGHRADGGKLSFDWDAQENTPVPGTPPGTTAPQARQ
jgi:hypothetical protein